MMSADTFNKLQPMWTKRAVTEGAGAIRLDCRASATR
jgi:hypothetical protein